MNTMKQNYDLQVKYLQKFFGRNFDDWHLPAFESALETLEDAMYTFGENALDTLMWKNASEWKGSRKGWKVSKEEIDKVAYYTTLLGNMIFDCLAKNEIHIIEAIISVPPEPLTVEIRYADSKGTKYAWLHNPKVRNIVIEPSKSPEQIMRLMTKELR